MTQYKIIRNKIYSVQFERWKNLLNIKSPYSLFKAIYYIETASLFLFLTQKIVKSPNLVTLLYIFFGLFGAMIIIVNPNDLLFFIGLFMVFTRGTFDWADGPLARRLNKTSFLGHALDEYGAHVCDSSFRVAFIFYTFNFYQEFMFLFPIFSFVIIVTKFNLFSDSLYFKSKEEQKSSNDIMRNLKFENNVRSANGNNKLLKIYNFYVSILDERARGIDFLLLILLFDLMFDFINPFILLFFTLLIVLRALVKYTATSYLAYKTYKE